MMINIQPVIHRVSGLHQFQLTVQHILSWNNKLLTLLFVSIFSFLCLSPLSVIITPHLLILYYLTTNYHTHLKHWSQVNDNNNNGILLDTNQYQDNSRLVQSFLDKFCHLHDMLMEFKTQYMSWSYPHNVWIFLKLLLLSCIATFTLFYYIQLNYIVLIAGWSLFISHSPLFELSVLDDADHQHNAGLVEKCGSQQSIEQQYLIAIYENQRWWLSLGFISRLLSSERSAWSDYSGQIKLPPLDQYITPPGFVFVKNSEWQVDQDWGPTDKDSWVYSDHFWESPEPNAGVGCVTRRRKWRRYLMREPLHKTEEDVAVSSAPSVSSSDKVVIQDCISENTLV